MSSREITRGGLPQEWVLLGVHLDSWDLGTGAQDDATGVVMVLEAARAIALVGRAHRRSIRFALWAAEEPGPPGSAMFVKRHASELRDCIAVLNTDNGAGQHEGGTSTVETICATRCSRLRNVCASYARTGYRSR